MRMRRRWIQTRPMTLVALGAAFASVFWAVQVAFDDFAVTQRAERLRSADSDERIGALLELTLLVSVSPEHAPAALPHVLHALRDPHPIVRAQALTTLSDVAGSAGLRHRRSAMLTTARHMALTHLDDPSIEVCCAAAGALGRLGPTPIEARPHLVRLAMAPNPMLMRTAAISQLARLEQPDAQARATLALMLRDADPLVRATTVEALGPSVATDLEAAKLVLDRLDDPERSVRSAAFEALRTLTAPPAVLQARFEAMLAGDDVAKAQVGAELLGRMGRAARGAAPALWRAHRRHSADNPASPFVAALARVAPDGDEARLAIAELTQALGLRDPLAQFRSVQVIAEFHTHAASAAPALHEAARNGRHPALRDAADAALRRIGTATLPAATH
jgi:HEAT repeat protein